MIRWRTFDPVTALPSTSGLQTSFGPARTLALRSQQPTGVRPSPPVRVPTGPALTGRQPVLDIIGGAAQMQLSDRAEHDQHDTAGSEAQLGSHAAAFTSR
jgi:hypothetical protein